VDLRAVLDRVTRRLRDAGIDHALIGGLAMAAHGAPRATGDVDLLVDGDRAEEAAAILADLGYACLYRSEHVANFASEQEGRVDLLFARRTPGRRILARAACDPARPGDALRVVDVADLIGLKVQSSSNDPARLRIDLADIERLLRGADVDLERVREYFRLFDREAELDRLLAELRR